MFGNIGVWIMDVEYDSHHHKNNDPKNIVLQVT
jgi:hypothetical protein